MSDYLFLMESRLSREQWTVLQRMQKAAEKSGVTLYLVGGAVRDLICGLPIEDLDFVVEGKSLEIVKSLASEAKIVWQSAALQTSELEFNNGVLTSVSMAHTENYSNGHTPVISPAPILADLRRRDFSINAIGISLNAQSKGLLLDPTNGVGDIENKEIRVLHNRAFIDDPSRILRCARFRTRMHFTLETKTAAFYDSAREHRLYDRAHGEALLHELRQIARERNPVEILKALEKEKLLVALHPHLQGSKIDLQSLNALAKVSLDLVLAGLKPTSFDLFYHLFTSKLSAGEKAQLAKRLEVPKATIASCQKLESDAKRLAKDLAGKEGASPTRLYNLLASASSDMIALVQIEFAQASVRARLKSYFEKYLPLRYQLPSRELEVMGIAPGTPKHQQILDAYFFGVIEGKLKSPAEQTKFLIKMAELQPAGKETKKESKKEAQKTVATPKPVIVAKKTEPAKPAPKTKQISTKPALTVAKAKPAVKAKPAPKPAPKAAKKTVPVKTTSAKKVPAKASKIKKAPKPIKSKPKK
jgi:tRNA nucleotidyltransferase (CCA-adding enzyme)